MTSAARTFLRTLTARREVDVSAAAEAQLDAAITDAHAVAQVTWTPVALPLGRYAQHLGEVAAALPTLADPAAALASLHLGDLYLACAAGLGLPDARELFALRFLQPVAAAVATVDGGPGMSDDVRQALHENLLLGDGAGTPPKILQYGGRAALATWLGVAARRAALGLLRESDAQRRAAEREAEERLPILLDPELQFLKDRYRPAFKAAVGVALSRLGRRERTIIRLHSVGGMTLARIARLLQVDESTVSRWEKRARETIVTETQRELGDRLGVRVGEMPSLARLVGSQLDVSVARLLADEVGSDGGDADSAGRG